MEQKMDGKKIKAIYWPDTETEHGRFLETCDAYGELRLSVTYHGDHDEAWIVQTKGGKEVARHNPRYIETVIWFDAA